ncbi:hypothetical protein BKA93DRAFT_746739 [Sparassis latifolia]
MPECQIDARWFERMSQQQSKEVSPANFWHSRPLATSSNSTSCNPTLRKGNKETRQTEDNIVSLTQGRYQVKQSARLPWAAALNGPLQGGDCTQLRQRESTLLKPRSVGAVIWECMFVDEGAVPGACGKVHRQSFVFEPTVGELLVKTKTEGNSCVPSVGERQSSGDELRSMRRWQRSFQRRLTTYQHAQPSTEFEVSLVEETTCLERHNSPPEDKTIAIHRENMSPRSSKSGPSLVDLRTHGEKENVY